MMMKPITQGRLAYHGNLQYIEGGGKDFYRHYGRSLPLPRTRLFYFLRDVVIYTGGAAAVVFISMVVVWTGI